MRAKFYKSKYLIKVTQKSIVKKWRRNVHCLYDVLQTIFRQQWTVIREGKVRAVFTLERKHLIGHLRGLIPFFFLLNFSLNGRHCISEL